MERENETANHSDQKAYQQIIFMVFWTWLFWYLNYRIQSPQFKKNTWENTI